MALQNPWIRYVDRSYQQIKERVLQQLQNLVPEMTDHTESNPYVKIISIWAGMTEHLNYFIDNAARELFLSSARRYDSAVKISKMFDYRLRGVKFASADITFTLDNALPTDKIISVGTIVSTADGIEFITKVVAILEAGELSIVIPCEQKVLVPSYVLGTSNGSADQEFLLTADTADRTIVVTILGVNWTFKETLAYSNSTDKHFTTSLNLAGISTIKFGDGVQGAIPDSGQNINVSYATSLGTLGNLAENSINTLVSDLALPVGFLITVINLNRASGGADIENLNKLKKNIPLSIRTLGRAVTKQDYEDIAVLTAGVANAGVVFTCGKTVDVYIVPEGGGVASAALLTDVRGSFYDATRMITTAVRILPAGELKVTLEIQLTVLPEFNKIETELAVKANLLAYINEQNRSISGALRIGNIYEIVENTQGVSYCQVNVLKALPYARIISGTKALNWTREVLPASTTIVVWTLKYSSLGELELLRNGVYAGTYELEVPVNTPEITFTVATDTYTAGDTWEFLTYPNNESLILNEPSVSVLYEADLTLITTGGV